MFPPNRRAASGWRYALSLIAQATGYTLGTSFIYATWRDVEIAQIRQDALEVCKVGYVVIDSPVSATRKQQAWSGSLKPAMIQHWKHTFGAGFDANRPETWPQPASGKCYEASSKNNKVPQLPLLTTDNYKLQAMCVYLVDPELEGRVHFGVKTHPKLLLLMSPLALLAGGVGRLRRAVASAPHSSSSSSSSSSSNSSSSSSSASVVLEGSDQSWHLVNLPSPKHGHAGQAVPFATHIDGGESNAFQKPNGRLPAVVPLPPSPPTPPLSSEEKLLLMMLHQLCILFHCETPGDLLPVHGATGFYPQSHLVLLSAWNKASVGGAGDAACIPWASHVYAIRQVGQECASSLVQVAIPEAKQLVAFGLCMHTVMWAEQAMGPQGLDIRVIQSAKIKCAAEIRQSHVLQRAVVASIPQHALIRVLARADRREWQAVLGVTDVDADRAEALSRAYLAYAKQAPSQKKWDR